MAKIPVSLLSVGAMLVHILAIPVFFLLFVLLYRSTWMVEFVGMGMGMGSTRLVFNTLMLMCILTGILCGSRIPMTAVRRHLRLSWLQYTLWSLGEIVVAACFMALYMALMYGDYGYFPALGRTALMMVGITVYPYMLTAACAAAFVPDREAKEDELIRFADTTGRLKLVIAQDVLLYIEARENYIDIHYLEGEIVKAYSLRSSMRGIEELMERHGIVRCQRSYYVNPRHVHVLRRDKEGIITAELDVARTKAVPVSPKYYESLSRLL